MGSKINADLFFKYFSHIELYQITNLKTNLPFTEFYIHDYHPEESLGIPNGTGHFYLPKDNLTWNPDAFLGRIGSQGKKASVYQVKTCKKLKDFVEFPDHYSLSGLHFE